ncbi:MAG TPA: TIGR01777 family oxidoreductase, partial [Pyrinomonadaceae bacterium]|nr:TIGR01777 family oxidoreductase [Pyrinomonadaceae bacterium]
MKIVVTGATGLVGSALVPSLLADGHEVTRLVRSSSKGADGGVRDVLWNPAEGKLSADDIEGHDAAVHLAGENVAERWTDEKKRRIKQSRVEGTRLLSETLARLRRKPRVLVSASATGFYGGDRGEEVLTEESAPGKDFLADVCKGWESACDPARAAGVRTVNLRIGAVLTEKGGALAKMLPPFRLGAGGRVGSGRQWMSWIALDDLVGLVKHALEDETLQG